MDYDTMKTFALSSERPFYDRLERVCSWGCRGRL